MARRQFLHQNLCSKKCSWWPHEDRGTRRCKSDSSMRADLPADGYLHIWLQSFSMVHHLLGLSQWFHRGPCDPQMVVHPDVLQEIIPISKANCQFYLLMSAHQKRGAWQSQTWAGSNMESSHLDPGECGKRWCAFRQIHAICIANLSCGVWFNDSKY